MKHYKLMKWFNIGLIGLNLVGMIYNLFLGNYSQAMDELVLSLWIAIATMWMTTYKNERYGNDDNINTSLGDDKKISPENPF